MVWMVYCPPDTRCQRLRRRFLTSLAAPRRSWSTHAPPEQAAALASRQVQRHGLAPHSQLGPQCGSRRWWRSYRTRWAARRSVSSTSPRRTTVRWVPTARGASRWWPPSLWLVCLAGCACVCVRVCASLCGFVFAVVVVVAAWLRGCCGCGCVAACLCLCLCDGWFHADVDVELTQPGVCRSLLDLAVRVAAVPSPGGTTSPPTRTTQQQQQQRRRRTDSTTSAGSAAPSTASDARTGARGAVDPAATQRHRPSTSQRERRRPAARNGHSGPGSGPGPGPHNTRGGGGGGVQRGPRKSIPDAARRRPRTRPASTPKPPTPHQQDASSPRRRQRQRQRGSASGGDSGGGGAADAQNDRPEAVPAASPRDASPGGGGGGGPSQLSPRQQRWADDMRKFAAQANNWAPTPAAGAATARGASGGGGGGGGGGGEHAPPPEPSAVPPQLVAGMRRLVLATNRSGPVTATRLRKLRRITAGVASLAAYGAGAGRITVPGLEHAICRFLPDVSTGEVRGWRRCGWD